uniref:RNA polymerase II subunit A n=2 Tax=Colobinae TaxID=9569 RepID=A0A2K6JNE6_RHIBE
MWTPCAPRPMTSWRSSRCWALKLCGRPWSGSCTTSSRLMAPMSITDTWLSCVIP